MAEASDVDARISDIIECSICTEVFTNPKVLPCIHTFCLKCLEVYAKDKNPGDEINCPLCRSNSIIPEGGIQSLPGNFFVERLLDINKATSKESADVICDICTEENENDKKIATWFCMNCCQNLCVQCHKMHLKSRSSKLHQFVKISSQQADLQLLRNRPSFCTTHPDMLLDLYCRDCKIVICYTCLHMDHDQHKCSNIKKASDCFKEILEKDLDKLSDVVIQHQKELEKLNNGIDELIRQTGKAEIDINSRRDTMKQSIDIEADKLLEKLSSLKHDKLKEMETSKEDINRQITILESFKKYVYEVKNKGTSSDIAHIAKELHDKAEGLQDIQRCIPYFINIKFQCSSRNEAKIIFGNIAFHQYSTDCLEPMLLNSPSVIHTIPGDELVSGVAVLNNELYVTRLKKEDLEVYDIEELSQKYCFKIHGLRHGWDMDSCSQNSCLYITDYACSVVFRVEPYKTTTKWSVGTSPTGVSVTSSFSVLVTCNSHQLKEYTTHGSLLKEITLPSCIQNPFHSLEMDNGKYIISYGEYGLCIAYSDGQIFEVISDFQDKKRLTVTRQIALASHGYSFVENREQNCILLFNPSLKFQREFITAKQGLSAPSRFCLDQDNGRFYVGSASGKLYVFSI